MSVHASRRRHDLGALMLGGNGPVRLLVLVKRVQILFHLGDFILEVE